MDKAHNSLLCFSHLLHSLCKCIRLHRPKCACRIICPYVTQGDAMWQAKLSEGGKTLVLTVWSDKTQLLTVEQASQLTLPEFGRLWKVHLQSLSCVCHDSRCNAMQFYSLLHSASLTSCHGFIEYLIPCIHCMACRVLHLRFS